MQYTYYFIYLKVYITFFIHRIKLVANVTTCHLVSVSSDGKTYTKLNLAVMVVT